MGKTSDLTRFFNWCTGSGHGILERWSAARFCHIFERATTHGFFLQENMGDCVFLSTLSALPGQQVCMKKEASRTARTAVTAPAYFTKLEEGALPVVYEKRSISHVLQYR
jgi:hypothetical protein